jgi:hypothetical protein
VRYTSQDGAERLSVQAMKTAIKANRKISTAPATGKTTGIKGTMASTASTSWASLWGADMVLLSEFQWIGVDFNYKPSQQCLKVVHWARCRATNFCCGTSILVQSALS